MLGCVAGDLVALLVNNLGGTSVLELNIVAKEAISWLGKLNKQTISQATVANEKNDLSHISIHL